jgi:hypothetical protein
LPDRGVVHVQVITDSAHHDFAGVQPDPDLHFDAVGAADLLHSKGSIAGAHRVVFVGDRRPE